MSAELEGIVSRKVCGSAVRRSILMTLAACANNDGAGIYQTIGQIAIDAEVSDRTVQQHIRDMLASGLLLECEKRPCKHGFVVGYAINVRALMALPDKALDRPVVAVRKSGSANQ